MLKVAAIAAPTMAWQAVWDNMSQSAHLICCATVLADYAKILLLLATSQILNPKWSKFSKLFREVGVFYSTNIF